MFEEQGIGSASIEAIAAATGLTRGGVLFELSEQGRANHRHARGMRRNLGLLAQHANLDDFIAALKAVDRSGLTPLAATFFWRLSHVCSRPLFRGPGVVSPQRAAVELGHARRLWT